ncbi:MAG: uncharacterized protein QG635_693 [Bacteroidota bacterium]|nr:uncharacterized protein [Bacteroidota bacterium]
MNKSASYIAYQDNLLGRVKQAVLDVEPEAEVYMFGSRARGDYQEDSDWDFLMLLPGEVSFARKIGVSNKLIDIELTENQMLNRIIFSKNDWSNNIILHGSPFYESVYQDMIPI